MVQNMKEKKKSQPDSNLLGETEEIQKVIDVHPEKESKLVQGILIGISVLFLFVMLVLPVITIIYNSLSKGFATYIEAITEENAVHALGISLLAMIIALAVNMVFGLCAAWVLSKFEFRGKGVLATLIDIPFSISPVVAGLAFIMMFGRIGWAKPILDAINDATGWDIKIVFAVPGVILATIFVTLPFVVREILPVLNSVGKEEEEAAALMGASGFTIFRKITFPHIKWPFLYGIILCTARALGEFGAVSAVAKTRGKNFTLPLEINYLYFGSDTLTQAFAVSSILVIIAVVILIIRNIVEAKAEKVR